MRRLNWKCCCSRSRSQGEVAEETAGANSSGGRALEKVVRTAEGRAKITRLGIVPFCSTLSRHVQ